MGLLKVSNIKVIKMRLDKIIELVIFRSWWIVLFLIISYIGFDRVIKNKNKEIFEVKNRLELLEEEKQIALNSKEELLLRINSQSDSSWVEMILMKELGVVPEGQLKVHFYKK